MTGTAIPRPWPTIGPDEGGIDPDDLCGTVGESASRVPRVEGGVGLDDVSQQPVPRAGRSHQAAAERAYHPCAHGTLEAERVADGNDQLADPQSACIAEPGRLVAAAGNSEHRQVAEPVSPTTSKGASSPVVNAAVPRVEPWTTCADVTSSPSAEMTTAEPAPFARRRWSSTLRAATEGSSCSATEQTVRE